MSRETKLGIAFIGILLTVFTGLLVKKLTRPSNRGLNANVAQSTGESAATPRPLQPTPPTLVTPKSENSKPSVLAALDARNQAGFSSSSLSNTGSYDSDSLRVRANSSIAETPPAVLSTPRPIADMNDARETARTENTADRYAGMTPEHSTAALPHTSGYGSPAESARNTSPAVAATNAAPSADQKAADEIPNRGYSYAPASDYRSATTAASSQPATANQTVAAEWGRSNLTGTSTPPSYRSSPTTVTPLNDPNQSRQSQAQPASNTSGVWPPASSQGYSTATMAPIRPQPASATGIAREGDQYEVQPNDSFWTISEKAYGTGAYFKALCEHNRKRHKNREELTVGQTLSVPDEAVLRRAYPDLSPKPRSSVAPAQQRLVSASSRLRGPGRIYTVVEGDTLFEIARHELGKPARWGEIYELNRELLGKDFDYLRPGTELILPANSGKSASETATRPADMLYPR